MSMSVAFVEDAGPLMLELEQIILDPDLQMRVKEDEEAIKELAGKLKQRKRRGLRLFRDPLVVFYTGARYYCADGFHRWKAAKLAGLDRVPVEVKAGTKKDARLYALKANGDHGSRLTNEDKRKKVLTAIRIQREEGDGDISAARIAEMCSVTKMFANKVMAEPSSESTQSGVNGLHLIASTYREGKDGKLYPSKRSSPTPRTKADMPPSQPVEPEPIPESEEDESIDEEEPEPEAALPVAETPKQRHVCPHCQGRGYVDS